MSAIDALKRWGLNPTTEEGRRAIKRIKRLQAVLYKQMTPDEYAERTEIDDTPDPSNRTSIMSRDLATAIFLKNRLKERVDEFKEKAEHAEKGDGYTQSGGYLLYMDRIRGAESRIAELEREIANLKATILEYNQKINDLDKEKLNADYDHKVKQIFDDIERLNSKLVGRGAPSVLKEATDKTKFNLKDPQDVEEAKKVREEEDPKEDLVIIHPALNHKKPSPGNAIITCKDCDEVFYLDKKELKQDPEDPDTYNKDMQCENCGAQGGYDYVGDVALRDTESAKDAIKEREAGLEDDFAEEPTEESTEELEPIDDVEEPEEIIEESFDGLVNKYLNKVYENITSYKTTSITQTDRNTYLIEGVFSLNDNKELKTSFLLESVEKKNSNFVLKGSNEILCEDKEPFEIRGKVDNKKMVFESFKYNYVETVGEKQYLVEGLEENK